jgi:hypothetical protein
MADIGIVVPTSGAVGAGANGLPGIPSTTVKGGRTIATPSLPPDFVYIAPLDLNLPDVIARLGESAPVYTGGVGGWEAVPRPGRRPLTVWRGVQEPLRLQLSLLLDRFLEGDEGYSVEPDIVALERMGGLDAGDPEPPLLVVEGQLGRHDMSGASQNRWVIESLDWGDAIRRQSDGHRVRQAVTVTLLEHKEDDRLARVRKGTGKPKARYYTAKSGDTFAKIAASKLGSAKFAARLARLNSERAGSIHRKLKAGRKVRLPSASALADWKRGK